MTYKMTESEAQCRHTNLKTYITVAVARTYIVNCEPLTIAEIADLPKTPSWRAINQLIHECPDLIETEKVAPIRGQSTGETRCSSAWMPTREYLCSLVVDTSLWN